MVSKVLSILPCKMDGFDPSDSEFHKFIEQEWIVDNFSPGFHMGDEQASMKGNTSSSSTVTGWLLVGQLELQYDHFESTITFLDC